VFNDPSNPNHGLDPTNRDQVFDSRFGTEADAIAYAEANGQGPLTTLADGSLINQYGETMVYDSSGNLAPAPRDVPVGQVEGEDGQFVDDPNWSPEQAVDEAMANAEIAAQVDAQAAAEAAAQQAAAQAAAEAAAQQAAAQAAAEAAAQQAAAQAAAEAAAEAAGQTTNPRLGAAVEDGSGVDLDIVGVSVFDAGGI
jgi:pyruvate/2-oxoglutarate dehydrogenase complex dihydrolipoamide acyltransferase (E2) component